MITEEVTLRSTDGLELEGVLDSAGTPGGGFLLCHPHPRMGGTMKAPLLLALRDELVARRWAVLRFNFRGIGGSEGTAGLGEEEVADAEGALAWLRRRLPGLPLAIGGWSFGAAVAVRVACAGEEVVACVAIAPAVVPKEGITAGMPRPEQCSVSCPLLVVTGANDDQVAPAEAKAWADGVDRARYVELPGANHFFWARYGSVASTVAGFLDEIREKGA